MDNTVLHGDIHTARLTAWLRYNGQRGTSKQIAKLERQFPASQAETLDRMLAQRGIRIVLLTAVTS